MAGAADRRHGPILKQKLEIPAGAPAGFDRAVSDPPGSVGAEAPGLASRLQVRQSTADKAAAAVTGDLKIMILGSHMERLRSNGRAGRVAAAVALQSARADIQMKALPAKAQKQHKAADDERRRAEIRHRRQPD